MTRKRISALGMAILTLIMTISTVILDAVPIKADGGPVIEFHYHRADGDYDPWSVWMWGDGQEGNDYPLEAKDGDAVAKIELPAGVTSVGFIVRTKDWAKDYDEDQFIDISEMISGTVIVKVESGVEGAKWTMRPDEAYSHVGNLNLLNSSVIDFNSASDGSNFKKLFMTYYKSDNDNYCSDGGRFNADGGIIKMAFDGSKEINYGCPYLDTTNYNGDFIYINKEHIGDTSLILTNISEDTSKVIGRALVQVKNEQGTFNVKKTEGALSWTNYDLEAKKVQDYDDYIGPMGQGGNLGEWTRWIITGFSQESAPTTSVTTLLSTITAGYDTWRNDTDKFNERMGELRLNGVGNEGVWVRTKGSEFGRRSSNGSYTNKQQTYQLGYDAVTSKDDKQTTYTGVAAEYGKGSLSFDSGTGTMKSMGLGVYQTKMYESGHYLDLVGRFDKYKNDFHVADTQGNAINGKYGNNALSMSAEYGRKNELKHGWYIEPQSEVTLGYMFGNDFTTSNNIRVEQKNMPALIGRLGLNIGREVSDKVNFYVKASINHDFLGNYDMQMTDLKSGERLGASDRFGSSWFDYGAGLSVKTGKDSYAYFDIERAVGGEYKKNWDWNAGVRWSF